MCCLAGYTKNCDERVHGKNSSLHRLNTTNELAKNIVFNALCKKKKISIEIYQNIDRDNSVFPKLWL